MPFESKAQQGYMYAHPEILGKEGLKEWSSKTDFKHLPEHVKKREEGGPVEPGEKYLVGEKGPEILEMEKAGRITPTTIIRAPYQLAHAMRKGEKGGSVEGE